MGATQPLITTARYGDSRMAEEPAKILLELLDQHPAAEGD